MSREAADALKKARELLAKKQGQAALPFLERALSALGDDAGADVHSDHGRALSQSGREDEALEAFSRAIDLAPSDPKYRLNRAILRENTGDPSGAAEDLLVVIEHQPEREEVRWMYVRVLLAAGDEYLALTQFDEMLELNPENLPALAERARLQIKLENLPSAEEDLAALEERGELPPEVQAVVDKAREELAAKQAELEDAPAPDLGGLFGGGGDETYSAMDAAVMAGFLVAKADGEMSHPELQAIKNLTKILCAPELDDETLAEQISTRMLDLVMGSPSEHIDQVIRSLTDPRDRANAFLVAAGVGSADGEISPEAREVLDALARGFEIPVSGVELALEQVSAILSSR